MKREWLWALAAALLISSAALGWMAWQRGEVELFLFLIIPVLKAQGAYGAASLLLAFAALMVFALSFWIGARREALGPDQGTSVGGVIMIGPIPIVLANDRRAAVLALLLAILVLIAILLLLVQ